MTTVREYCGGLTRSRLLPGEQVNRLYNAWRVASAGMDGDVEGFRRFLVGNRHLTEYQASLIQRGHTDGFILGGHVVLDRIGSGHVFKALHPASGQLVALHILPPEQAANPAALAAFQRAARRLAMLDHPTLPRAFPLASSSGLACLAMELIEGESLADLLSRRGRLPVPEAARLAVQLLDGLHHAHERGMLHGRIHPGCLLLNSTNESTTLHDTVKILDLGIQRELFEPTGKAQVTESEYAAPEATHTAAADIYSVGCVLVRLLTAQASLPGRGQFQSAGAGDHPLLKWLPEDVPDKLREVLEGMTAKHPSNRFDSAAAAAAALRPYCPARNVPAIPAPIEPGYLQWIAERDRPAAAGAVPAARNAGGSQSPDRRAIGLAAAVGSGVTAAAPSPPPPPTLKPPTVPPRTAPRLAPPPQPAADLDVELLSMQDLPAPVVAEPPSRPLWELDRRDFIMLGLGSCGVIAAVGIGIFAAKFNSDKIRRGPEE